MAYDWMRNVTQGYGPTDEPLDGAYNGAAHFNKGIDYGVPTGTAIDSNVAGKVVAVSNDPNHSSGWGKFVWVQAADGTIHQWGHMDSVNVKVGDSVAQGQVVGTSGDTGKSTGPHVSYDVQKDGQYIDPSPWVGGQAASGGQQMTQPTGRNYSDPDLDSAYEQRKQAFLQAQSAWIRAGRPQDGDLFNNYAETMADIADFTDQFGHPKSTANDIDPAQQEFENRIKAGDFAGREADRAFQQWYNKYVLARDMAEGENETAQAQSEQRAAAGAARAGMMDATAAPFQSPTEQLIRPQKTVMNEYLGKLGISDQPPAPGGGIALPGAGGMPGAAPVNPNEPTSAIGDPTGAMAGMSGGAPTNQAQGPGNPWDTRGGTNSTISRFWQDNPPEGVQAPQAQADTRQGPTALDRFRSSVTGGFAGQALGPLGMLGGSAVGAGGAKAAGKKVKKWWQRAFAEGGKNIPGGPGYVGERGPEIMEVPGFGSKIVGQGGPEEVMIPEGANIMPLDEAYMFHQIKGAAKQGRAFDRAQQQQSAQARANDPQLREKVMASLQKSLASKMAVNPGPTPVFTDPSSDGWDPWAPMRKITGIPASAEEYAMQQQAAQKGAKR